MLCQVKFIPSKYLYDNVHALTLQRNLLSTFIIQYFKKIVHVNISLQINHNNFLNTFHDYN